jgi:hypothetical protein
VPGGKRTVDSRAALALVNVWTAELMARLAAGGA